MMILQRLLGTEENKIARVEAETGHVQEIVKVLALEIIRFWTGMPTIALILHSILMPFTN